MLIGIFGEDRLSFKNSPPWWRATELKRLKVMIGILDRGIAIDDAIIIEVYTITDFSVATEDDSAFDLCVMV